MKFITDRCLCIELEGEREIEDKIAWQEEARLPTNVEPGRRFG